MDWPEFATEADTKTIADAEQIASETAVVRYRVRPLGDFVNVKGKLIDLYGCSFAELDLFLSRVQYLQSLVRSAAEPVSFDELLANDRHAMSYAKWCLEAHGLSLSDVSLRQLQDLLFYEVVDGKLEPGLLLRINTPRTSEQANEQTLADLGVDLEAAKYERAVAILSSHTDSVEEAINLTYQLSAQQLTDLMSQKADIAKQSSEPAKPKINTAKAMQLLDRALSEEA